MPYTCSCRGFHYGTFGPSKSRAETLARIEARVSSEQKRLFEKAAEIEGVTLTDFAVVSMHRAATRALQLHHAISLSLRDQDAFVDALMNPPAPNEDLRRAAKRYAGTAASR